MIFRALPFFLFMAFSLPAMAQEGSRAFEEAFQKPAPEDIVDPELFADVRGFVWGLGRDLVRDNEFSEFLGANENVLVYRGKDFGFQAFLQYYFYGEPLRDGKLGRAEIIYNDMNSNPQDYLNDYIKVQDQISKIFGAPSSENIIWKDDRFQDDEEMWGVAAMMGQVQFLSIWSTRRSVIQLILTGADMRADMRAIYISKTVLDEQNAVPLVPDNPTSPEQP